MSGDACGVVDAALPQQGLSRRVALTVPSLIMALATLAQTELLGTLLPRHMVEHCAAQFGLVTDGLGVLKHRNLVCAIATRVAMRAGRHLLAVRSHQVVRMEREEIIDCPRIEAQSSGEDNAKPHVAHSLHNAAREQGSDASESHKLTIHVLVDLVGKPCPFGLRAWKTVIRIYAGRAVSDLKSSQRGRITPPGSRR